MLSQGTRFVQTLPTFSKKDAIGNNVRAIQAMLQEKGWHSCIAADSGDACDKNTLPLRASLESLSPERDVLIYHMAIGCEANYLVARAKSYRKIMIYHNITPSSYFCFEADHVETVCREGRNQLGKMKNCFDLSIADSDFNAAELKACGYKNVLTIPLVVDLSAYDKISPDARILSRFFDISTRKANILFVGRGVPNKCPIDAIIAYSLFHKYYCPNSRFLIAGGWLDAYRVRVEQVIRDLSLEANVLLLGRVTDAELKALYVSSHLFLCMSEHEGFCVPLLEAMHFDVPVLAFASSAVPETLGDSGVLFYEKNFAEIAKMMALLVQDGEVRQEIIASQRRRLLDFSASKIEARFRDVLQEVL